ncbi:MAG: aldo/keto reductase [Acetivibrionales bacterium]
MKYRKLGKTNFEVSVIGIGTWQYCGQWGKEFTAQEVKEILDKAYELGFNLIDTAECYGDHVSERLIGQAIEGKRENWIISTKFGHKCYEDVFGPRDFIFDAKGVKIQLEDSLRALKTDYIDIYLFHSGSNEHLENDDLWTMLDKEKKAGKIKHLGISIHPDPYDNIHQVSLAEKYGAEVIELLYNRLDRNPEDGVFHICQEQNLGVIARVPLAQGYLSGKYKPGMKFPKNDVRHTYYNENVHNERLARAQAIQKYEVPAGMDMASWAMAWCLQHPAVSTCIPGFKNIKQLENGASAADLDMVSDNHPLAVRK